MGLRRQARASIWGITLFRNLARRERDIMTAYISPRNLRGALRTIAMICLSALAVQGCMIPHFRGVVHEPVPVFGSHVTSFFPVSLYRLASGDVLEFLYLTTPGVTATPYRLQPKDLIDVEFNFHPEMNARFGSDPTGRSAFLARTTSLLQV